MSQNRNESGMRRPLSGFLLGSLSLVLLGTAALISSCSTEFGGDNVANVYATPDSGAPSAPAQQVPESMKTNGGQPPPQGIY
jgi:hypothetical protein